MRRSTSILGGLLIAVAGVAGPAGAQGDLPSARARYEIKHGKSTERLDVLRMPDRVEHHYLDRDIVEVWQRDANGELEHWKLFPSAKRSVHYTAGDLRTVSMEPAWEQLGTLINPRERARLKATGTRRTPHGLAVSLEGSVERQEAHILWNERTGWAENMVVGTRTGRTTFRLVQSDACTHVNCVPVVTSELREIEFADLGDSENDPFVRTYLAKFAGHSH